MKKKNLKLTLPIVPLKDLVVFPGAVTNFDAARPGSKAAFTQAQVSDMAVFLVPQKDPQQEWPESLSDLYEIGCVGKVVHRMDVGDEGDAIRVLVLGGRRARLKKLDLVRPVMSGEVELIDDEESLPELEEDAYRKTIEAAYRKYIEISGRDSVLNRMEMHEPSLSFFCDILAKDLALPFNLQQEIMELLSVRARAERLILYLNREYEVQQIRDTLQSKLRAQMERNQREYYLREEMKVIREEMNDGKDDSEIYQEKLDAIQCPDETRLHLQKEVDRLSRFSGDAPEGVSILNYLDHVFDLPWGTLTEEQNSVSGARKILDRDHYGLEKVKERVLEYLAVHQRKSEALKALEEKYQKECAQAESKGKKLSEEKTRKFEQERYALMKSPILCLVGPPGVGKTSVAHSVAEALGRRFVRMSLGGVHDESEIRGHRRTYIASMPGRMIKALQQAKTDNPLILMDEIDKLGKDLRGDPSAALLEVLDPEQNRNFRDHYLEVPYDLSKVVFITTANDPGMIPEPLFDRMEIIPIQGYMEEEKFYIAKDHLLPRIYKENAVEKGKISIDKSALLEIIRRYTRESGVRQLERCLNKIVRKALLRIMEGEVARVKVNKNQLKLYLGTPEVDYDRMAELDQIGVAKGLAWTSYGGDTLAIEVNTAAGTGRIEMTGSLGDVMKESITVARSYVRSCAEQLNVDPDFYKNLDLNIHVPAGATPKDGPSAGVTMVTALVSALTKRPVRRDIGMTGEVTLRGNVLPIGGLKEKLVAAIRAGLKTVVIPSANAHELEDLPEIITSRVEICPCKTIEEVLEKALVEG